MKLLVTSSCEVVVYVDRHVLPALRQGKGRSMIITTTTIVYCVGELCAVYLIIYVSDIFQIFVAHFHSKNANNGARKLFSCCWPFFKTTWELVRQEEGPANGRQGRGIKCQDVATVPWCWVHAQGGEWRQVKNWGGGEQGCFPNVHNACSLQPPSPAPGSTAWCWWPLQDRKGFSEDKCSLSQTRVQVQEE